MKFNTRRIQQKNLKALCKRLLCIFVFLLYTKKMHELAIVTSLLELAKEEMHKHGAEQLLMVRVRFGPLANIVPEALQLAFESMTSLDEFTAGAKLEMQEDPLILRCGECFKEFTPAGATPFAPCSHCGSELFHQVIKGKELFLDHLEAE